MNSIMNYKIDELIIKIKNTKEDIDSMKREYSSVEFDIDCLNSELVDLENSIEEAEKDKERMIKRISEIENSEEYEERVVILPGQISLMEVI